MDSGDCHPIEGREVIIMDSRKVCCTTGVVLSHVIVGLAHVGQLTQDGVQMLLDG